MDGAEILEVSENRVVMQCRIAKTGRRYALFIPASVTKVAEKMHESGRKVKVTIEVEGDEQ